ncbi:hypothetical protein BWQ96_10063 [Gracilariopsis chorda]|uniref:SAC3/GANP/THP3 conserved domain-containing protein n=1 Tax=Gracilariopsis chorda TaxID=448386 RepID=A0A2V3IDQ8_9FLOR|nr:hypothetical protein BWQ96_10063 [Gracilariopsis chorda]|eukprot:PXF40225.1 hypothetical protein BWQ96_10063 [Gracilariopsis chorda]
MNQRPFYSTGVAGDTGRPDRWVRGGGGRRTGRGGRGRRGNRGRHHTFQRHGHHESRQTTSVLGNTGGAAAVDESIEELKARNRSRFSTAQDAGTLISSPKRTTFVESLVNKRQGEQQIGVGRATGLSRVPDSKLSSSAPLVKEHLKDLTDRMEMLLRDKLTVLGQHETEKCMPLSEETHEEWETIQGRFRKLTMSITASSNSEVKELAIPVYEKAADASLYSGNLSFYLSCQTRLLRELYAELKLEVRRESSRYSEFIGYALLYFGVFHADNLELAQVMRGVDRNTTKKPSVRLALSIISAFRNRNAWRVLEMYKQCDERQRVLLIPLLEEFRREALNVLIHSYISLSKSMTTSILGMKDESEFLPLLAKERPGLAAQVDDKSDEFSFRIVARK